MDILLNIEIPAVSENYDVLVPDFLTIKELIALISDAVENMTEHRYKSSGNEVLCYDGNIICPQHTLKQCSVSNGDHLMMF